MKEKISQFAKLNKVVWRKHALTRILERGITRSEVLSTIINGEILEMYPTDFPFPSALFYRKNEGKILHVVAALNENDEICYIITAYRPSEAIFEPDNRTRKKL